MNYYKEIENIIKKIEVNTKTRIDEENNDRLTSYWKIGKILIEAQGGEKRAKYGNQLIKEWSINLTKQYGKGYNYTNLTRFRTFYLYFPILATVSQTSWSLLVELLPMKEESKRNYYFNLCISQNFSVRELRKEIKSNSYERLLIKPEHIEIINQNKNNSIKENIKNPIIIELNVNEQIANEKDLELFLLAKLKNFFRQLGEGFALIDNQYKITYQSKNYYIDILLFNYKLNRFIVVELKTRKLRKEDKSQIEFYMKLVDKEVKEPFHNKTIGIIITKEQDKLIASFISNDDIIPLTYKIENKIQI